MRGLLYLMTLFQLHRWYSVRFGERQNQRLTT